MLCELKVELPAKRTREELELAHAVGDSSVSFRRYGLGSLGGKLINHYACKFDALKQEIEDYEKQRLFNHSLKAWLNRNAEYLKLSWFKSKDVLIKLVDEEQATNSARLKEAEEQLRILEGAWIKWKLQQGVQVKCNKTKKG